MPKKRVVQVSISIAALALVGGPAHGQAYPSKPIRIVTATAGGGSDFMSRLLGQGITGSLAQPVIVENRGGILAAETVAKAAPDGYTLLLNAGTWYIATLLQKQSYDPVRDFVPIAITNTTPNVLVVHPSLPVKNAKELIALAKARPGDLNYGHGGIGGAGHLSGEFLKMLAKVDIVSVPYKGSGRSVPALVAGEVQLTFSDFEPLAPHVQSGRLRAIAVTSAQPSALFPSLPTLASTVPGYVSIANTGTFAPAKTLPAVITRLNQEIVRYLKSPEARDRILKTGSEAVGSSPDELAAWMKADMGQWGKVIKEANIKAD
jgi:tripartite-type tricarboxylate transporter receptor subunit TctC